MATPWAATRDNVQKIMDLRRRGWDWNRITERTGRTYGWFYSNAMRFHVTVQKRPRGRKP